MNTIANVNHLDPEVREELETQLARPPRHHIGGNFQDPSSGASIDVEDPGAGAVVGQIARGDAVDISRAVESAEAAMGVWQGYRPSKRSEILERVANAIRQDVSVLGALESIDTGKPFVQSTAEAWWASDAFRYYAGWATKIEGSSSAPSPGVITATLREPAGVCGAITAWNFPLILSGFKIAPALAFGNAAVVKPAEQASLSTLRIAEIMTRAGVPGGLVNVVTGLGEEAGAALVDHPSVARISFTGSTAVGKLVGSATGARLAQASLELGGKSPNVVFADADLHAAARGVFRGMFQNAGQMCAAGTRIIVERTCLPEFVDRLRKLADGAVVGHGLDPRSTIGPLIEGSALARVEHYVSQATTAGAEVAFGGQRPTTDLPGHYFAPTALIDQDRSSKAWHEEIFGPIAVVTAFDSPEEAITLANDTAYGLGAGVWGGDMERVLAVGQAIRSGSVWMNGYGLVQPTVPFGGFGDSGNGRELGSQAMDFFTDTRTLWLGLRGQSI